MTCFELKQLALKYIDYNFMFAFYNCENIRIFGNLELCDIGYSDKVFVLTGVEAEEFSQNITGQVLLDILEGYESFDVKFTFTDGYSKFPNVCTFESIRKLRIRNNIVYLTGD